MALERKKIKYWFNAESLKHSRITMIICYKIITDLCHCVS